MKKGFRRLTALLLALVLLAAAPLAARAEDAILIYKLGDRQYLGLNRLTGVLVNATESLPAHLDIPAEILGYPVKAIADKLFYGRDSLTSVTVPGTIETIGDQAFSSCRSLQMVTLQEGIKSLGKGAFRYCYGLKTVRLPSTLTTIENDTFDSCIALEELTLPEGVTTLGDRVFANCSSLRTVKFPSTVTAAGEYLFNQDKALESIELPPKLQTMPIALFNGCTSLKSVKVPSSVKTVGKSAFGDCSSLERLVLPEGVQTIEDWAFNGCSALTTLSVPSTVEQIAGDAFYACDNVTFYVKAGSYAQVFASANNRPFVVGTLTDEDVPPAMNYPATPFADAEAVGWARDYIRWVYAMGYMGSTSKYRQQFSPQAVVSRGQIVTILYNMEGRPKTGTSTFRDLKDGWYKDAVAWAQANGVVNGKTATTFVPAEPVTREQFAAILYRYASYKRKDLSKRGDLSVFSDAGRILPYARTAVTWAVGSKIIEGKGNGVLDPKGSTTRAEAAVMMYKFCNFL